jgi:hypothetical protein
MKLSPILLVAVAVAVFDPRAQADIPFGLGPSTYSFNTAPDSADWFTLGVSGAAGDMTNSAQLDALVQTVAASSSTNVALDQPGSDAAHGIASWYNGAVFTRPTSVGAAVLIARLHNISGDPLNYLTVSYPLGVGSPNTEQVPGQRVYWSQTGQAGSWRLVGQYGTTNIGTNTVSFSINVGSWPDDGLLYLLWADDNGSGSPDTLYSMREVVLSPEVPPLSVVLTSPTNQQTFAAGTDVTVDATVQGLPTNVTYYLDGSPVSTWTIGPFAPAILARLSQGNHGIYARAQDGTSTVFSATNTIVATNVPVVASNAPPIVVFQTGFEISEGYYETNYLAGQPDWADYGYGDSGVLTDGTIFPGMGQQGYIGYYCPYPYTVLGPGALWVWPPVNFTPPPETPMVRFSVDMEIIDSTNGIYDDFRWIVYHTNGNELFELIFDNDSMSVLYLLENSTNATLASTNLHNRTRYHLQVNMDFLHNRWSATLDSVLLATNQPITFTNTPLALADIDAVWVFHQPSLGGGNNLMAFDNYTITREAPPGFSLAAVARINNDFSLQIKGEPGWRYAVDTAPSLPPTWTPLRTNTTDASSGLFLFTETNAPPPGRFYRARLVP